MNDPEILLLDEPTTGIDSLMRLAFLKVIEKEKKKGKTILISSHLYEEREKVCDRVALIDRVRIINTTDMNDVKNRPIFKQSCKANAMIWTFVTSITCAMLAIIILVLGNLNVGTIRDSMVDMFVENAIESTITKQSMTYFNMTENALIGYEDNCKNLSNLFVQMDETRNIITSQYEILIERG